MTTNLTKLINAHKAAAKTDGAKKAIDSLHSELEKFLEDYGQKQQFDQAATEFLKERTKEVASIRCARNCMLWVGTGLAISAITVFYFVLLCPQSNVHLASIPDASRATFITASFVGSFGLIAIILRGILRNTEQAEKSPPIPEAIKAIVELMTNKNHS